MKHIFQLSVRFVAPIQVYSFVLPVVNSNFSILKYIWRKTLLSLKPQLCHLRQCILFVSDWQSMESSVIADGKKLNQMRTLVYWLPAGLPCTNLPGGLPSNQCTNQSIHNWSVKFLTSTLWHLTKVRIVKLFNLPVYYSWNKCKVNLNQSYLCKAPSKEPASEQRPQLYPSGPGVLV